MAGNNGAKKIVHTGELSQHLGIPEAQDRKPFSVQECCSGLIVC
jgi:hypothetical protein